MEETTEEFEPLFDYSRVQPIDLICLDDESLDLPSKFSPKRIKISDTAVGKVEQTNAVVNVIDCEEDDWLPPPPKISDTAWKLEQDSTIQELRLKKQELASFAVSAQDVLRAVEEAAKRELDSSLQSGEGEANQPSKPQDGRAKIIISIQDKDDLKQFRIYMDDKFERIFKMYSEKVKRDLGSLVFTFDGDKVNSTDTPDGLGMEDNDIIEVQVKRS